LTVSWWAIELVTDRGADKVGTIGVEPLLHEKIDMTQVNVTEIDRYLLAIGRLRSKLAYIVAMACPFPLPSARMANRKPQPCSRGIASHRWMMSRWSAIGSFTGASVAESRHGGG